MKKLYIYLYKRFLFYFLIIFPAFATISVLVELIELLRKIKHMDVLKILMYIGLQLPEKAYYMLPIAVVIVLVLVARELINSREIYAILINGISLKRISISLLILTMFLTILQIANLELIMPKAKTKAGLIYLELKSKEKEKKKKEEIDIVYNTWISVEEKFFMYFAFLDFSRREGKNLILIKFDNDFNPVYTVEAESFKIDKNKFYLEKGKIIDVSNIYDIYILDFNEEQWNINLDLHKLKQLIKVKKPISLTQLYETAKAAEKFGHSYAKLWSKFYSKLATVFSPFILAFFALPLLWTKNTNRLFIVFIAILGYWYGTAFIASITETGIIPYYSVFIIDILYLVLGLIGLSKLKFIEL